MDANQADEGLFYECWMEMSTSTSTPDSNLDHWSDSKPCKNLQPKAKNDLTVCNHELAKMEREVFFEMKKMMEFSDQNDMKAEVMNVENSNI